MKKGFVLLGIILVGLLGFIIWWVNGTSAPNKLDTSTKVFVIEPGEAIRVMGSNLKKEGLIKDPIIFFLYVKKNNLDKKIQAGDYKLSPSMSLSEVMKQLTTGRMDVWVQVKEGIRTEEIAEILQKELINYDDSWLPVLKDNEGYLFPDTYLIPANADVNTVVAIMRDNFNKKVTEAGLDPAAANIQNTIILASIIERESRGDPEKPTIAGILNNRMADGIPLQVDATVQYAKGKEGKWWPVVEVSDYKNVDSPFNTYLVTGLPPGPISNPGIEAIVAAAKPASTQYYYYIHEEDGTVHFAKTDSEHINNINRYLR